jgi:CYTH domain-containing protein
VSSRPPAPHRDKYARLERERRFLLAEVPPHEGAIAVRRIVDRYLNGTRLRVRQVTEHASPRPEYKLTQKVPSGRSGPAQGLITNTYLSRAEHDLLATLPAALLTKTRHSIPPLGVDVFDPPLHGLVLAEAEFDTASEAHAFAPPDYVIAEVTDDPRFTGGRLARASRSELLSWLGEYGITPATNVPQPSGHRPTLPPPHS